VTWLRGWRQRKFREALESPATKIATRQGYNVKALADLLNAKPAEVRSFLRGKLPPSQTQEFQIEMRAAGLPLSPFSMNAGSWPLLVKGP
jgi:hypothetical protein